MLAHCLSVLFQFFTSRNCDLFDKFVSSFFLKKLLIYCEPLTKNDRISPLVLKAAHLVEILLNVPTTHGKLSILERKDIFKLYFRLDFLYPYLGDPIS